MADTEIRRLERLLADNLFDVETRQRLLSSYLRTGALRQSDIADLAALGDAGAIALLGTTPTLDSRPKKFYLRCAFVVLLDFTQRVRQRLQGVELDADLDADLNLSEITINAFNQLMEAYLAGRSIKATVTIPTHRNLALRDFSIVFQQLRHGLHSYEGSNTRTFNTFDCYYDLLHAYQRMAAATGGNVRRDTTEVLETVVRINNDLREMYYTFHDAPRGDVALWNELITAGVVTTMPEPTEQQPIYQIIDQYYTLAGQQMLRTYRNQIIHHWLPWYPVAR